MFVCKANFDYFKTTTIINISLQFLEAPTPYSLTSKFQLKKASLVRCQCTILPKLQAKGVLIVSTKQNNSIMSFYRRGRLPSPSPSPSSRSMRTTASSTLNSSKSSNKFVTYLPTSSAVENVHQGLRVIQRVGKIQKLESKIDSKHSNIQPAEIRYKKEMFDRLNTETVNNISYQVLAVLHPEECELKFQFCWPITERKLESVFRKTAFTWIKEIAEIYPKFFEHSSPQVCFFVTPTGEKCLHFWSSLIDCALFILCQRAHRIRGKPGRKEILPCPESNSRDAEILIMETDNDNDRIVKNVSVCSKIQQDTINLFKIYEEWMANQKHSSVVINAKRSETDNEIIKIIKKRPEIFPENAPSLLRSRDRLVEIDEVILSQHTRTEEIVLTDKLLIGLEKEWRKRLLELKNAYEKISFFLENYKPVFDLLNEIVENYSVVLDARNYPTTFQMHGDGDIGKCINTTITKYEDIRHIFPSSVFQGYATFQQDYDHLIEHARKTAISGSEALVKYAIPVNIQELQFQLRIYRMTMENTTDWNKLLTTYKKEQEPGFNLKKLLTLTPVNLRNFNRTTGLTPTFNLFKKIQK